MVDTPPHHVALGGVGQIQIVRGKWVVRLVVPEGLCHFTGRHGLGHTQMDGTVGYLGVDLGDALCLFGTIDLWTASPGIVHAGRTASDRGTDALPNIGFAVAADITDRTDGERPPEDSHHLCLTSHLSRQVNQQPHAGWRSAPP